jgi:uncharacterized surface protein with fasciclin (FAS1) repeats
MKIQQTIFRPGIYFLLLLLTSFVFVACDDDDDDDDIIEPTLDVVELAQATPNLSTLVTAIGAANLTTTLKGPGPFTVFAPTNTAFNALPDGVLAALLDKPEVLAEILQYHVVSGKVFSSDLSDGDVNTLLPDQTVEVDVNGASVTLNGSAMVSTANIEGTNGVVHIIDEVLIPENFSAFDIVEIVMANDDFSTLETALGKFPAIVTALQGDGPFTVFAPTNAAFEKFLMEDSRFATLADIPDAVLEDVLQYHVIAGQEIYSSAIAAGDVPSLQGENITISLNGSTVVLNGNANVANADVPASNGVIHVIDNVILPPTLQE